MTKFNWARHGGYPYGYHGPRPGWSEDDYPARGRLGKRRRLGILAHYDFSPKPAEPFLHEELPPIDKVLDAIRRDVHRYRKARKRFKRTSEIREILIPLDRNLSLLQEYSRPLPAHTVDLGGARRIVTAHRKLIDIGY